MDKKKITAAEQSYKNAQGAEIEAGRALRIAVDNLSDPDTSPRAVIAAAEWYVTRRDVLNAAAAEMAGANGAGKMSDYDTYEDAIIIALCDALEIGRGDAQGMVEANSFYVAQGWGRDSTPAQVAARIAAA